MLARVKEKTKPTSAELADCFSRMLRRWDRRGRKDEELLAPLHAKLVQWCNRVIEDNPVRFLLSYNKKHLRDTAKKKLDEGIAGEKSIDEIEASLHALLTIKPVGSPE